MANAESLGSVDGALAEYSALFQEIMRRHGNQQSLLTLQLTITGAVFSVALSTSSADVLLILPLTTYLLSGRYAAHQAAIVNISNYIENELGPRVPGGLPFERWFKDQPPRFRNVAGLNPLFVAFPGSAILGLVALVPT